MLEDAPIIQKHFNNWNIIKNLLDTVPWPYPDDGAEDFIKNNALPRMAKGEAFIWTIQPKENPDDPIGMIEFRYKTDRDDRRGFWLAEPYWKQGYMTEAVSTVNDFIFNELKVDRIVICNFKGNEGSRRVKEKTGATYIGTCEKNHHQGKTETELWELTAEQWEKFKAQS